MGMLRKRGRVWWIKYYRNGRPFEESAHTANYEDARDLLKQKEGDIAHGVPVSPRTGRFKFDDAATDLVTEYEINGRRTKADLERRITLHLLPWFGGRRMTAIDAAQIRAFTEARLTAGAAPAEVNRELA